LLIAKDKEINKREKSPNKSTGMVWRSSSLR